jgi:hypothetical protein
MATGDKWAWITAQRILGYDTLRDNVIGFFRDWDKDILASVYKAAGSFQLISIAGDGVDKFKLTGYPTNGNPAGIDGAGELLDLFARYADVEEVQFENLTGNDYHVGIKGAYIPDGISVGQGDGMPTWNTFEEVVGESGTPNSVVDNGNGTLTFVVDAITEALVSNAGRRVVVYRTTPTKDAVTEALAKEECVVAWDGSNNKITTVGDLGLLSGETPAAGNYTVVLLGPRVMRDTDLSADPSYAYIGTVSGLTGAQPTAWSMTYQNVMGIPLSDLTQITRYETFPTPDRLKINVTSVAAEENQNLDQIRVTGWDGIGGSKVVFQVDELGNVTIEGDLEVKGTTTQQDTVQVNASETITDNLTAGDADTDSHAIQGEWTHSSDGKPGGAGNVFAIDGDTGRVGIGGDYVSGYDVAIFGNPIGNDLVKIDCGTTGKIELIALEAEFDADIMPGTVTQNIGSGAQKWKNLYVENIFADATSVGGHMKPDTDDSYDLGDDTTPLEWRNLYIDGIANIDELRLSNAVSEGVGSDLFPTAGSSYSLGASGRAWEELHANKATLGGVLTTDESVPHVRISDAPLQLRNSSADAAAERNWSIFIETVGDVEHLRIATLDAGFAVDSIFFDLARKADLGDANSLLLDVDATITLACSQVELPDGADIYPVTTGSRCGLSSNKWEQVNAIDGYFDKLTVDDAASTGLTAKKINMVHTTPEILFDETGADANESLWNFRASAGAFYLYSENDSSLFYWVLKVDKSDGNYMPTAVTLRSNQNTMIGGTRIHLGDDSLPPATDGIHCYRDLLPNGTISIGASGNLFEKAWLNRISVATDGVESDLVPSTGANSLGSNTTNKWANGYIDTIYPSTTDGKGCASTFKPTTDGNLDLGSTGRRWSALYLEDGGIDIDSTIPLIYLYENNADADEKKWWFRVQSGEFTLRGDTDVGGADSEYVKIERNGVDMVNLSLQGKAAVSNIGWRLYLDDDAQPANQKVFVIRSRDGDLYIDAVNDTRTSFYTGLVFVRDGATSDLERVSVGQDFTPTAGSSFNLGSSGLEWLTAYVDWAGVRVVSASGAGEAGYVTYSGETAGVTGTSGNSTIKSSAVQDNSGWITVFIGTAEKKIPYFDAT